VVDEPLGADDPLHALSVDDRLFEYRPFVPPDGTGAIGWRTCRSGSRRRSRCSACRRWL